MLDIGRHSIPRHLLPHNTEAAYVAPPFPIAFSYITRPQLETARVSGRTTGMGKLFASQHGSEDVGTGMVLLWIIVVIGTAAMDEAVISKG